MPSKRLSSKSLSWKQYSRRVAEGDRVALGRAITLLESKRAQDRVQAEKLLASLQPLSGKSIRIGITGSPGVGKSTFIEVFGKYLTSLGKKIAVLTIDPSSRKTKGSILGDKTRMNELSKDPLAFIRPTPSGLTQGGVASATQESIILCESAGYEVIIVETVGVGQSEVAVRSMVDFFLLLILAGAGDELQGIKKGIMEMADGIIVTKDDGDNITNAKKAQAGYRHSLHLMQAPDSGWLPHVLTASAIQKKGIADVWQMIESFRSHTTANGFFHRQREEQLMTQFHGALQNMIANRLEQRSGKLIVKLQKQILSHRISPAQAAKELFRKATHG